MSDEPRAALLQEGVPVMGNKSANDSNVPSSTVQVHVSVRKFVAASPARAC